MATQITPDDVVNKHFITVHLRRGYDEEHVDDLLDAVVAHMREGRSLRPLLEGVKPPHARRGTRGYDPAEVDRFFSDLLAQEAASGPVCFPKDAAPEPPQPRADAWNPLTDPAPAGVALERVITPEAAFFKKFSAAVFGQCYQKDRVDALKTDLVERMVDGRPLRPALDAFPLVEARPGYRKAEVDAFVRELLAQDAAGVVFGPVPDQPRTPFGPSHSVMSPDERHTMELMEQFLEDLAKEGKPISDDEVLFQRIFAGSRAPLQAGPPQHEQPLPPAPPTPARPTPAQPAHESWNPFSRTKPDDRQDPRSPIKGS